MDYDEVKRVVAATEIKGRGDLGTTKKIGRFDSRYRAKIGRSDSRYIFDPVSGRNLTENTPSKIGK